MRFLGAGLILAVAACSGAPRGPLHPAVEEGAGMTDEQEVSFFQTFDENSFRALAERAYRDRIPEAEHLLFGVVWNWYPGFPEQAERRRRAQRLLVHLTGHVDARVREGAWRLGRFLYNTPETSAAWSTALPAALEDPEPDVRLAAIRTSIDLHRAWTGGCIVEEKKTLFSLRPHAARLAVRLFQEPDGRVRQALLWALSWGGESLVLPIFTRYFTEADRREEMEAACGPVRALFSRPVFGWEPIRPRPPEDLEASWTRLRAFAETLQETNAARRNAIVLLLITASEWERSLSEDRRLLGRVVEWLEREEEVVREDDLHLVLRHWRVMDHDKVVHQLHDVIRRSNLPEILKALKETLSRLP